MKRHGVCAGLLSTVVVLGLVSCPQEDITIEVDGITRSCQVYVPQMDYEEAIPLVVALHPLFLDSRQMRQLTRFDAIAEREGFMVAYPEGLGRQWDVWFGGEQDLHFLTMLIDKLIGDYNVDPGRVYVTGASNGGMMCHQLACCAPGRIAAIAPVMGTPPLPVFFSCDCTKKMPVMIIHGTADAIVPYEGLPWEYGFASVPSTALYWAEHNGCGFDSTETRLADVSAGDNTTVDLIEYDCDPEYPVLLYRVNGGGHTWPGNIDFLPQLTWGRVSMDIDASELIWEFFRTKRGAP